MSPTASSPRAASRSMMARRVGSDSAANSASRRSRSVVLIASIAAPPHPARKCAPTSPRCGEVERGAPRCHRLPLPVGERSRAKRAGEGPPTYAVTLAAVFVVPAQPGHRAVAFVPPLGHEVEILIGRIERVETTGIAGVGAIDRAVGILVEDTQPRRFFDAEPARSEIVVVAGFLQIVGRERD